MPRIADCGTDGDPGPLEPVTYVALLRGVNVGGNRPVPMADLRDLFLRVDMKDVRTYINSGNVVFTAAPNRRKHLVKTLESAIHAEFGFPVQVIVRDATQLAELAAALPADWVDGRDTKCDVMFLAEDVDSPSVMERLTIKPGIDDVRYVNGSLLWRVERGLVTRSGMRRIAGTDLYSRMTVRNCNTTRKLIALAGAEPVPPPRDKRTPN